MSDLLKSAESLNAMFWPRACAVLGASDNPSKIGGIPVRFFKEYGYEGDFYPINPTRDTVQGLPAVRTIEDVDGPVDMAIMAVPEALAIETQRPARERCKGARYPDLGLRRSRRTRSRKPGTAESNCQRCGHADCRSKLSRLF